MKKRVSTILLILVLVAGVSLLLYPSVSDYWNSLHQSRAITEYADAVANLNTEQNEKLLQSAREFNDRLYHSGAGPNLPEDMLEDYKGQLNVSGDGVMGYIEIPSIDCSLPICHGTGSDVLQHSVGHIEGSSLPVGGENTHCVLSGHRGLPSAKLFTDLDRLVAGDIFILRTLDQTLTYEVDQILIVEPHQVSALLIQTGEDLCTLVTCTPYGVNSHRLLVRGHRVENQEIAKVARVTADAMQVRPAYVAIFIGAALMLVVFVILALRARRRKR